MSMLTRRTVLTSTATAGVLAVSLPTATLASLIATPAASPETSSSADATTTIAFAGETVTIDGAGATATAGSGTVTITEAGIYAISGDTDAGMIHVLAPGAAVTLVLDGVSITNPMGPAILIEDAEAATITLAADSRSVLTDGGEREYDSVVFSTASLTFNGTGQLDVHGTVHEGIESTMHLTFESGLIRVFAYEDGINANNDGVSQIVFKDAWVYVETETGDGIDSNGSIDILGGTVITQGALVDMNGGLDADGPVTIHGGTVIATGLRNSLPVESSEQESVQIAFSPNLAAGTLVELQDASGTALATFAPVKDVAEMIISLPALTDGETYTVFTGGTPSGEAVTGLYAEPASDPGTEVASVTTEITRQRRRR